VASQRGEPSRDAYGAKYPKAVECLTRDQEKLLSFFDFPAEHWVHLRTSNVVESPSRPCAYAST